MDLSKCPSPSSSSSCKSMEVDPPPPPSPLHPHRSRRRSKPFSPLPFCFSFSRFFPGARARPPKQRNTFAEEEDDGVAPPHDQPASLPSASASSSVADDAPSLEPLVDTTDRTTEVLDDADIYRDEIMEEELQEGIRRSDRLIRFSPWRECFMAMSMESHEVTRDFYASMLDVVLVNKEEVSFGLDDLKNLLSWYFLANHPLLHRHIEDAFIHVFLRLYLYGQEDMCRDTTTPQL